MCTYRKIERIPKCAGNSNKYVSRMDEIDLRAVHVTIVVGYILNRSRGYSDSMGKHITRSAEIVPAIYVYYKSTYVLVQCNK